MAMTWDEILNRAIGKEEEASSNYQSMAKRASNPGTQTMFRELAKEEEKHRTILTKWKSGRFPGCPASSLAEVSGIGEGRDIKFDRDLTPEEAMRLAIREEERAVAFYGSLAKGLEDAEARCLAERLAAEEEGHRSKLEKLLEEEIFQEM